MSGLKDFEGNDVISLEMDETEGEETREGVEIYTSPTTSANRRIGVTFLNPVPSDGYY